MNTIAIVVTAATAGVILGAIGTAMYYLPKIAARDFCIDSLLYDLDEQELMDERFQQAANKYKTTRH
jgi:hypothetical protein